MPLLCPQSPIYSPFCLLARNRKRTERSTAKELSKNLEVQNTLPTPGPKRGQQATNLWMSRQDEGSRHRNLRGQVIHGLCVRSSCHLRPSQTPKRALPSSYQVPSLELVDKYSQPQLSENTWQLPAEDRQIQDIADCDSFGQRNVLGERQAQCTSDVG